MTGKQIYSTVGGMYTSQGYNVIAPNDYISKKDLDVFKDSLFDEIKWEDEEPVYIDDYVER